MLKTRKQAHLEYLEKYVIENKKEIKEEEINELINSYIKFNIEHYHEMYKEFGKRYTLDMIKKDYNTLEKIIKSLI